jgi:hypothetical protein
MYTDDRPGTVIVYIIYINDKDAGGKKVINLETRL